MEVTIQLESETQRLELFGSADEHLRMLRTALDVKISARQGNMIITGKEENVKNATDIIKRMQKRLSQRGTLNKKDINELIARTKGQFNSTRGLPPLA